MKNNKQFGVFILSLCFVFSFMLQAAAPIISHAEIGTVYIGNAEELLEFANNCATDSWSKGKRFALTADIYLDNVDFCPIPSFSGNFDGAGYTVSGLNIYGAYAPAGLFACVEEGGSVKNLTLVGCVLPEGDKSCAGGIAGINRGTIEGCSFKGTVIGKSDVGGIVGINALNGAVIDCNAEGEIIGDSRTGGIAGSNSGVISSCKSTACVNTVSITPTITLDQLNSYLTLDISKLPSLNNLSRNDTGGIAGYSGGMILGCENMGEIGYEHIGYNVGGIVGRTSGHLSGNINCGNVYGRKDVGGVAGQAEPYVTYDLSKDLLAQLDGDMDKIGDIIDDLADSLDSSSSAVSSRLDTVIGLLGSASDSIDSITEEIGGWGNETVDEINRLSLIAAETLDRISQITGQLPALSGHLTDALTNLELFVDEMNNVSAVSRDALTDLNFCLEDLERTLALFNLALGEMENGINALKSSVKTDDAQGVRDALVTMSDGMGKAATAVASVSASMSDIADALGSLMSEQGDADASLNELSGAFSEISAALGSMAEGMKDAADSLEYISNNVTFDADLALSGVDMIGRALSLMADASVALEEAVAHLVDCTEHIMEASLELDEALVYMKNAAAALAKASDLGTEILTDVDGLIKYLAAVDPIQIPKPDGSVEDDADRLFITISSLESNLKDLNGEVKNASGEVTDIMRRLNDAFSEMKTTVVSAIYGITDTDSSYDDGVSPEEVASVTLGKIFDCLNTAKIYGDINVGGISGIMGIEYLSDPEDDGSEEISITQKRQYKLKAVIASCVNYGEIASKRDCAGGIAGKADMGLIYDCGAFCHVKSTGGSFVGGIAGLTAADVIDCYTKCELSGKKYVGGITGSGVTETTMGSSSLIRGCYAIVRIDSFLQYGGAISGIHRGEYLDNLFVAEGLRGIDTVNYTGKAEPISYAELAKRRSLPDELFGFTLTFLADGKVLASHSFEWGASFESDIYPEVPKKEGYYSRWDLTELENLTFDTTVNAVYKPYITAIGSEETAENSKHIFIVQGNFVEGDSIDMSKNSANDAPTPESKLFYKSKLLESSTLTVTGEGDIEAIRYLSEKGNIDIYTKQNGVWVKTNAHDFGSYAVFTACGQQVQVAVIGYSLDVGVILALSLAALLTVGAITAIALVKKKKVNKMQ